MMNILIAIIAMACSVLFAIIAVRSFHNDFGMGKAILLGILALISFIVLIWAIIGPVGTAVCPYIITWLLIIEMYVFVAYLFANSCY